MTVITELEDLKSIATVIGAIVAVITLIFLIIKHFSSRPNIKIIAKYQSYIKQSDCIELKIINKSSKIFVIEDIRIKKVKKDRRKLDVGQFMDINYYKTLQNITLPFTLMPDGKYVEPVILINLDGDLSNSQNVKFIIVVKNSLGIEFKSNLIDANVF
jgi:hypothetical protein